MSNELQTEHPDTSASGSPLPAQSLWVPMVIIGTLFFVFGFVTWLNGSLIPFLKIVCELNEFQSLFVTFAFYIAFTFMAMPSAWVLKHTGYKLGMIIGLLVMATGAIVFIPAAMIQHYAVFLVALFMLGTGITLLQTAANPYIVCIGPRESAAMRISIMGLVNKGAGVVVPIVFTALILNGLPDISEHALQQLSDTDKQQLLTTLSQRLIQPYIYMAIALIGLAIFIKFSALQELEFEETESQTDSRWGILKFPHVVLGALTLFTYVGVEVIAGDTIGLYGQGLGVKHFASLTSYTMIFMVLGYCVGVFAIPKYLSQQKALIGSAVAGITFSLLVIFGSQSDTTLAQLIFGWSGIPVVPNSVMFLALLGFANALVWPAVWPLALEGLGKYTAAGSALLIMGIAGGAIIPLIYGHFAQASPQQAYWVMLPCYAFILFYAIKGHTIKQWA